MIGSGGVGESIIGSGASVCMSQEVGLCAGWVTSGDETSCFPSPVGEG